MSIVLATWRQGTRQERRSADHYFVVSRDGVVYLIEIYARPKKRA
jgi:hypothetical protein